MTYTLKARFKHYTSNGKVDIETVICKTSEKTVELYEEILSYKNKGITIKYQYDVRIIPYHEIVEFLIEGE